MPQDHPVTSALPRVALLASPLLGAAVWRPAATALTDRGWDVLVVPGLAQAPRHPAQVLAHLLDALPDGPALGLVAHSNAGLYLPALAAERRVAASVYADAALPAAVGASAVASPRMHRFLEDLTDDDGLLPPWTQWWDEEQVAALFPDAACRAAVAAEQHRLPVEYFTASIAAPAGWTERPAAYLAFGDTYYAERDQAARWGWPVRTLPGGHLHPLVAPSRVAAALDDLLRQQLDAPSA